jgi:uncharacterized Fe-S center protein
MESGLNTLAVFLRKNSAVFVPENRKWEPFSMEENAVPTPVYFATAKQNRLRAEETLPAKLDLIIERLDLKSRVNDKSVAIKMHLGGNMGYSTIHPVFVRRLVQAVKDGGGRPFLTDTVYACRTAYERGYSHDTVGCDIIACAGPTEKYYKTFKHEYKSMTEWQIGGILLDADFLIDFAHVKGHPSCGFGGVFKNLALGAMTGKTRGGLRDTMHHDPYWFADMVKDEETRKKIMSVCPMEALVPDKENLEVLHRHWEPCIQCKECVDAAPEGAIKLEPESFWAFQEACAIGVNYTTQGFRPDNEVYINLVTDLTPVCDCFGFTGLPVLPNIGLFGGNDICAVEQATLDEIGKYKIIEENVPLSMKLQPGEGLHPFQVLHGPYKDPYKVIEYAEALGCGSREYEIVDVMPLEEPKKKSDAEDMTISAADL